MKYLPTTAAAATATTVTAEKTRQMLDFV